MKNIHILPTDKPSSLYFEDNNSELIFLKGYFVHKTFNIKPQNIYITSDEEIKVGDWYLSIDYFVRKADVIWDNVYGKCPNKKIILTKDQDLIKDGVQDIDDEFLEWFVKNPSCEFVEVVDDWNSPRIDAYEYKIIIPKEEPKQEHSKYLSCCKSLEKCYCYKKPKQETLEEAIDRISKENGYDIEGGKVADFVDGMVKGAKWQQERMYSEEDMVNYALFILNNNVITVKEWFEKFKKK